jgi:hypothetical protein
MCVTWLLGKRTLYIYTRKNNTENSKIFNCMKQDLKRTFQYSKCQTSDICQTAQKFSCH